MKEINIKVYVDGRHWFLKDVSFSDVYLTDDAKEALIIPIDSVSVDLYNLAASVLLRKHGYNNFESIPVDQKAHIVELIEKTIQKNSRFASWGLSYPTLSNNIYNLVNEWHTEKNPEVYVAFTEKIIPLILALNK